MDARANQLPGVEPKTLIEIAEKVNSKAVVDSLRDTPVDMDLGAVTKHWAMLLLT